MPVSEARILKSSAGPFRHVWIQLLSASGAAISALPPWRRDARCDEPDGHEPGLFMAASSHGIGTGVLSAAEVAPELPAENFTHFLVQLGLARARLRKTLLPPLCTFSILQRLSRIKSKRQIGYHLL